MVSTGTMKARPVSAIHDAADRANYHVVRVIGMVVILTS
jgi:hypothetical protein